MNAQDLRYWDDGGGTIDRYTAVWPDGSYLAMNAAPFHPQGFCQHGEGCAFDPDCTEVGTKLFSRLGEMIAFEDLPPDCQKAVKMDLQKE